MNIKALEHVLQLFDIKIEDVTLESPLDALGFDSLSMLELIVELESHFQISFNDDDLISIHFQTIGTLLQAVEKHLAVKNTN